jgi:hypothetical protein
VSFPAASFTLHAALHAQVIRNTEYSAGAFSCQWNSLEATQPCVRSMGAGSADESPKRKGGLSCSLPLGEDVRSREYSIDLFNVNQSMGTSRLSTNTQALVYITVVII